MTSAALEKPVPVEALSALADAFAYTASAAGALAMGHAPGSKHVTECLAGTRDGLKEFHALTLADMDGSAGVPMDETARQACMLGASVVEYVGMALNALARGEKPGEGEAGMHMVFSASKLTELMRLVKRPDYEALVARIWGWTPEVLASLNALEPEPSKERPRGVRKPSRTRKVRA